MEGNADEGERMNIICDAREYDALDPEAPYKYGASESLVLRIVGAMKDAGHQVDAIYGGDEEKFVNGVRWWPWNVHPRKCDVLIACEWLINLHEFEFKKLYVPLNKINPALNGREGDVDGFILFTEEHKRQLLVYNKGITEEQCIIIPAGVEPAVEAEKVSHRMIWCHTPERGLVHLARQWPEILKEVPDVTLAMTYGLERSWEGNKWLMDTIAEDLAECMEWKRIYADSIVDLGRATNAELRFAQAQSEVMSYPCDAPLPGIVTTFSVMECAAAGNALIVPHLEGIPEEFGSITTPLAIPIFEPQWVECAVELLTNDKRRNEMAEAGREWAKTRPWSEHTRLWQEVVS